MSLFTEYMVREMGQRPALIKGAEAAGNPNFSPLPKVNDAPTGTFLLQSDVDPLILWQKRGPGPDEWVALTDADTAIGVPLPAYVEAEFDFEDFPSLEKIVGLVPSDAYVIGATVWIDEAFDAGGLTLGDADDHGRIVKPGEVDVGTAGVYPVTPSAKYEATTRIRLYFGGLPTRGRGHLAVYFSLAGTAVKIPSLFVSFDEDDVALGKKLIGVVTTGIKVEKVTVDIDEAFDGGTTVSIGDEDNNERLFERRDCRPATPALYGAEPLERIEFETDIYLYFTGAATQGRGYANLVIS